MTADELIRAAIESDEAFIKAFSRIIKEELQMTASEFSEKSGIPQSTIYKLLSGHREPNIKTLRQIVSVLRRMEGTEKTDFIAVIAARPVLESITEKKIKIQGRLLTIREYSATSMEDAILAAIKAERDGAKAAVCAPIVSTTIEKVLRIPIATIMPPKESLITAIELAAKKMG
ncbi:putative transcriptional regulator with an HTH domain [Candidatus Methanoperedens nitroreducens]|uniref:Putative transcriptional regulator with an HTH domain n=1 Tax=Candidatus Methanoperedens nitratireducens TaxID=1392998 RepID=A0A062V6Y8_9EURY|nr:helix-turn-helix domain-containing protein [Candidatus Methanoperedens nitroreducens]KCZ73072.1 putative transcriptional regulator with an HTH domain [Candidatus Methanoperedens nitroreducens]MDJ1422982.1 helix-turn-helix domain-containing protein [Candidatus Methanoperedens sp.]